MRTDTPSLAHLTRQLVEQADALHAVAARAERAESALRRIATLVDALPVFADESEQTPEARAMRALREAVAEWRSKA